MESSESGSNPDLATGEKTSIAATGAGGIVPSAFPRVWAIALMVGIAAGFVSWGAGELARGFFRPRLSRVELMGMTSLQPTLESQHNADLKNTALAFGILGCVTCLAMGLAGGLAGRSPGRGLMVGVGIQAVGVSIAVFATYALIPRLLRDVTPDPNDLITPMLIHGGIWVPIAAVAGLGFAIGVGNRRLLSAMGGACLGGLLATILYHILSAMLYPQLGSTEAVSSAWVLRLLASLLIAVLAAAGAAWGMMERATRVPISGPSH